MPPFSFIHAADLHLDSPFASMGHNNPELASVMRSATFKAFDNVIQLCLDKKVDFLLISGDVYDGADRSLRAQLKFQEGLKILDNAGIRSFVVHGNHDPLNGWSSNLKWPESVHQFRDSLETIPVERDNELLACIQGISYPKKNETRNLARRFKKTSQTFHIGLLHANAGSIKGFKEYAPCTMADLLKSGMDYWALGHVHRKIILSDHVPRIVYPGNTQGRGINETGEKGCFLVRINEDKEIDMEFYPVDMVRWISSEISINDMQAEQDLINCLESRCKEISETQSGRPSITRISIIGNGPLAKRLKGPNIIEDLLELTREAGMALSPFVWVEKIKVSVSPEFNIAAAMEKQDFLGQLLCYSKELLEDEKFEDILKQELSLLFENSRARRFLTLPESTSLEKLLKDAEKSCVQGIYTGDD
jgi:DNA repair exonuclease SbcCD nuclease subunit